MFRMKVLVAFSALAVAIANGGSVGDKMASSGRQLTDCLADGDLTCMQDSFFSGLRTLLQKKSLDVVKGVRVEYTGDETTKNEVAKALEKKDWKSLLSDVFPKLVNKVALSLALGRGHKERLILPLLAFGGMFAFLITLGVIAAKFLAFKALLVGKISLVLAAITGLAKVFNQNKGVPGGYARIDNFGGADHPMYNYISNAKRRRSWVPA